MKWFDTWRRDVIREQAEDYDEPEGIELDNLILVHETDKAILVEDKSFNKVWLPKSKTEYNKKAKIGDKICVSIPEWLYDKNW